MQQLWTSANACEDLALIEVAAKKEPGSRAFLHTGVEREETVAEDVVHGIESGEFVSGA